ncbi:hypothetical protein LPJGGPFB_05119 [Ensifer adhaerens]|nr:hypothetical protein [Ensifer adhaerens]
MPWILTGNQNVIGRSREKSAEREDPIPPRTDRLDRLEAAGQLEKMEDPNSLFWRGIWMTVF